MDEHIHDFGQSISGVMSSLTEAATAMRNSATAVTEGAQRTRSATSGNVENAAGSARDLNSVAAATEQLAHSINEISAQVSNVTHSVRSAVDRAAETDARVAGLAEAADRIGDVVRLIMNVASQTNLLALNATIEAARAGDAGKGFAVVASEVKALATQTAGATDQIARQILAIREATNEAVAAVRGVGHAIGQVDLVATAIAAAVEQQAAATREITASVQNVTGSTNAATRAMEEILDIAVTDTRSQSALQAAAEIGTTAGTLQKEVSEFLTAMSRGDEAERRQYERIPGNGAQATLRLPKRPAMTCTIVDISQGGVLVACSGSEKTGTDLEIELPGGGIVHTRIARIGGGTLGMCFRQDERSLSVIRRALEIVGQTAHKQAA